MSEAATFTSEDGIEVFHTWWDAPDPKGTVVVAHGASEHHGRYARFAAALAAAGWSAAALDHRGHGRTRDSSGIGKLGPAGAEGLLADLGRVVALAADRAPGLPIVLLGHSMGSVIAQAFAARGGHGLSGYILSGPLGVAEGADDLKGSIQQAIDAGLDDQPLDLAQFNGAFEPARTPFDWLSRDADEVDRYIADPLCGPANPLSLRYIAGVLELGEEGSDPSTLAAMPRIPVLLIAGTMDPAGAMTENVRVLESRLREAGLDVTANYYPGARHELLNEINRDEVTSDVVRWLDRFS